MSSGLKGRKRIESPLATYNSSGQLFCILCNSPVKNELVWTAHVNGRGHRDALTNLKSKTPRGKVTGDDPDPEGPPPPKRPAPASGGPSGSGINSSHQFKVPFPVGPSSSSSSPTFQKPSPVVQSPQPRSILKRYPSDDDDDMDMGTNLQATASPARASPTQGTSDNRMNGSSNGNEGESLNNGTTTDDPPPVDSTSNSSPDLPEGFFDDPKLDAKARGLEWRDPEEVEWDKFMKEIATEDVKSSTMRVQDEEESTMSRELDEIEEQMAHWQKVIDLEKMADEKRRKQKLMDVSSSKMHEEEEELDDYDEEMDWRSKRH